MNLRGIVKKEIDVAIHAQSWRFRAVKYLVLLILGVLVYVASGWGGVGIVFGILLVFAIVVHLFYRHKTAVWTKSWGGYKPLS